MFEFSSVDKETAENIMGSQKYKTCHDFFKDFLQSSCSYKIIMTRRCFSLFKIFLPILNEENIHNTKGTKIITDKAVTLHSSGIMDALNSNTPGILIIDDVIIFGRTINLILDNLVSSLAQYNIKEDALTHIQVRGIVRDGEYSLIKAEYQPLVSTVCVLYNYDWRAWSGRLSKLISSSLIANTSYVVSAITQDQLNLAWFADDTDNRSVSVQWVNLKSDDISDFVKGAFVRIYHYDGGTNLVIPLVILRRLSVDDLGTMCAYICDRLHNKIGSEMSALLLDAEKRKYQARLQLATLLLSHSVLQQFFNQRGLAYSREKTDYKSILTYSFSSDIYEEFVLVEESLFDLLDVTFEAVLDDNNQKSLDMAVLRGSVLDVSCCRKKQSEGRLDWFYIDDKCTREYVYSIVRLIDSGRASIKTDCDKTNELSSLMFSGEQAFMIGVDYFSDIIEYFRYAEYLFGKSVFENLDSDYKLRVRSIVLDKLAEMDVIEDSRKGGYYSILEILDKNGLELEYIIDDLPVCHCMQENAKAAIKISIEKEVQSFVNRT